MNLIQIIKDFKENIVERQTQKSKLSRLNDIEQKRYIIQNLVLLKKLNLIKEYNIFENKIKRIGDTKWFSIFYNKNPFISQN